MGKVKTLKETIAEAQRGRVEAALAAGCQSVRQIAKHVGTSPSKIHRLLKAFGYRADSGWKKGKS